MRFHCLATDYDGTVAHDGVVAPGTVEALERVKESGRRLVLVTGRELEDLMRIFGRVDLFDRIVAENGAVLFTPATGALRVLAEPPPATFGDALARAGVQPLSRGHVVVATGQPHEVIALELIRQHGLELQVIFNKGAVMILPSGVNKATGLTAALHDLGLAAPNTVGIGDAENDHAFLTACGAAVAVADALPALRERADVVTAAGNGGGAVELCTRLVQEDLAGLSFPRLQIALGGPEPSLSTTPFDPPLLVAGSSGGGKSSMVTGLLERMGEAGHQYFLLDPEGDYEAVEDVLTLGTASGAPAVDEVIAALEQPDRRIVANLIGLGLDERPAWFASLAARLVDLRTRTGRPQWLVIDEAHHVLGASREPALTPPLPDRGVILVTVDPSHVAPGVMTKVGAIVALGRHPAETLRTFATAIGDEAPGIPPVADSERDAGLFWKRNEPQARSFDVLPSATERRRHRRKYAEGDLGACSFYFRGPEGALNLRAANLQVFATLAEGVDEPTWHYHLRRGDIARWLADCVKDAELAAEIQAMAADETLPAGQSRVRALQAIAARYTAPA